VPRLSYQETMRMVRRSYEVGEIKMGPHIDERVANIMGIAPTVRLRVRDVAPARRPMKKWSTVMDSIEPTPPLAPSSGRGFRRQSGTGCHFGYRRPCASFSHASTWRGGPSGAWVKSPWATCSDLGAHRGAPEMLSSGPSARVARFGCGMVAGHPAIGREIT
jgi:hypothetical protein